GLAPTHVRRFLGRRESGSSSQRQHEYPEPCHDRSSEHLLPSSLGSVATLARCARPLERGWKGAGKGATVEAWASSSGSSGRSRRSKTGARFPSADDGSARSSPPSSSTQARSSRQAVSSTTSGATIHPRRRAT